MTPERLSRVDFAGIIYPPGSTNERSASTLVASPQLELQLVGGWVVARASDGQTARYPLSAVRRVVP
jgi:hypothetical protein